MLGRDYMGKEADRLVTRIDPGVVSLVAELRGHERQAAEELASGKPASRSVSPLDASSPAAITLAIRIRELQETISSATIALEISSRNSRVAALQKRWDRLPVGLDLILDQRGADMADLPGGASELLVRGYRGKAESAGPPHRPRRGLAGRGVRQP